MKKRIIKLSTVYFIIAAVLVLYAVFTIYTGVGIPCVFRTVTGLNCPGCGISRAAHAVINMDFAAALKYNYMLPLEVMYIIYIVIYISADYLKNGVFRLMVKPEWLNISMLCLLILWGVIRNIIGV